MGPAFKVASTSVILNNLILEVIVRAVFNIKILQFKFEVLFEYFPSNYIENLQIKKKVDKCKLLTTETLSSKKYSVPPLPVSYKIIHSEE